MVGVSSLTADIGALAGLSLTWLCAPPPRPAMLHLLALNHILALQRRVRHGGLGRRGCAGRHATDASVRLCRLVAPLRCWNGGLAPSACVLAPFIDGAPRVCLRTAGLSPARPSQAMWPRWPECR